LSRGIVQKDTVLPQNFEDCEKKTSLGKIIFRIKPLYEKQKLGKQPIRKFWF